MQLLCRIALELATTMARFIYMLPAKQINIDLPAWQHCSAMPNPEIRQKLGPSLVVTSVSRLLGENAMISSRLHTVSPRSRPRQTPRGIEANPASLACHKTLHTAHRYAQLRGPVIRPQRWIDRIVSGVCQGSIQKEIEHNLNSGAEATLRSR